MSDKKIENLPICLLAAAPAMLEALEECKKQLLHIADDFCKSGKCARCIVAEQVEAAIRLAKGESQ